MKQMEKVQNNASKRVYESPEVDMIRFSCEDIITASRPGDNNQGEWDPQPVNDSNSVRWGDLG